MVTIAVHIIKAFLMIVPAIIGLRIFFMSADAAQDWTGYRFSKRDIRRFRWVLRVIGLLLIGVSALSAWNFLV
ncbi:MAG: hypothetical protein JJU00_08735 [Opitutales bacterium]|nr:hypothetical protein [Opitutales bacterium]